jgi:hypothetical protein
LQPVTEVERPALLALAAMVGMTRLIDNTVLEVECSRVSAAGREAAGGGWV